MTLHFTDQPVGLGIARSRQGNNKHATAYRRMFMQLFWLITNAKVHKGDEDFGIDFYSVHRNDKCSLYRFDQQFCEWSNRMFH